MKLKSSLCTDRETVFKMSLILPCPLISLCFNVLKCTLFSFSIQVYLYSIALFTLLQDFIFSSTSQHSQPLDPLTLPSPV